MASEVLLLDEAERFLVSVSDKKLRAKAFFVLKKLRSFGHKLKYPDVLSLEDGIKELRVKQGSNILRLFYFHDKDKVYIVLCGYIKKRQKLDRREFGRALKIKNEYLDVRRKR